MYESWDWAFEDYGQDIHEGSVLLERTGRHSKRLMLVLWWNTEPPRKARPLTWTGLFRRSLQK